MIRRLIPSDREIYIKMAEEFYSSSAVSHSVPKENFGKAFDHMVTTGVYMTGYLFELDDSPAGFGVIAKTYSQEAGGTVIWIEDLYVRSEYRGKGLATDFFSRIGDDYKDAAVRWRLEITKDNIDAKRLYERIGFETCPYIPMIKEL